MVEPYELLDLVLNVHGFPIVVLDGHDLTPKRLDLVPEQVLECDALLVVGIQDREPTVLADLDRIRRQGLHLVCGGQTEAKDEVAELRDVVALRQREERSPAPLRRRGGSGGYRRPQRPDDGAHALLDQLVHRSQTGLGFPLGVANDNAIASVRTVEQLQSQHDALEHRLSERRVRPGERKRQPQGLDHGGRPPARPVDEASSLHLVDLAQALGQPRQGELGGRVVGASQGAAGDGQVDPVVDGPARQAAHQDLELGIAQPVVDQLVELEVDLHQRVRAAGVAAAQGQGAHGIRVISGRARQVRAESVDARAQAVVGQPPVHALHHPAPVLGSPQVAVELGSPKARLGAQPASPVLLDEPAPGGGRVLSLAQREPYLAEQKERLVHAA